MLKLKKIHQPYCFIGINKLCLIKMKKYTFTIKSSDEVIGVTESCETLEDAIEYFSKVKDLEIEDFIKIYNVKEIKNGRI